MAQPNLTAVTPCRELEPRERVHRHRVRLEAADVAQRDLGATAFEQRRDTGAEPRQVGGHDRATDRKGDLLRQAGCHQEIDPRGREISSVLRPMSSGAHSRLSPGTDENRAERTSR